MPRPHTLTEEVRYRLLKQLADDPHASQRDLARALGISLGKVNYCLRALIDKGLVKARSFRDSENKAAYAYILTRRGIEEKLNATKAFLRVKIAEYDTVAAQIRELSNELEVAERK